MATARIVIENLFKKAGIKIGENKSDDIVVHDKRIFNRILRYGSLGAGEAYMDNWWDTPELDKTMSRIIRAKFQNEINFNFSFIWLALKAFLFNRQSRSRAKIVGENHYDIGNDLYSAMLGTRMVYTCGYWKDAKNLDEAQEAKLDLLCKKIGLKKGDRVLDIGCGWGSFAKYAAEKYGATVVGVTISKEQAVLARVLCKGLPVEIRVQDYREVNELFDHIVSIGMFEHVGYKNYREFFQVVERCLKDTGLFLLHTIGGNFSCHSTDPWIDTYIFPNGMLPSPKQIGDGIDNLFVLEDWHSFGPDYYKTLMAWFHNFDDAWPSLKEKYGQSKYTKNEKKDRFYRMWKYYLLSSAGAFHAREIQLWQIVLSKKGIQNGYTSLR